MFDNLYFVGTKFHSSWALTTREGIILIDTLYDYASDEAIVGGLRKLGFSTSPAGSGKAQVLRDGIGAIIEDRTGEHPHVNKAGFVMGDEIGLLVNRGFQMFWRSTGGRSVPALAIRASAAATASGRTASGMRL